VPLLFDDERADVLFARLVLAVAPLDLALAGFAAARPEAALAPADLAPVALAPVAFAAGFLAAVLAVLRAVERDAEAGLEAPPDRVVRALDALLVALRLPALRVAVFRAPVLRALALRAGLLVALSPGVIDRASCSMSFISERFVDLASRRRVRSVSATSLYALRAFLPRSERMVCSA
jgi:hypothetical protein